MKLCISKIMAALVALVLFITCEVKALPSCKCTTNWVAIPTVLNANLTGPWCPATIGPTPGPTVWICVTQCVCMMNLVMASPPTPPWPSPLQVLTNYPASPSGSVILTNAWSIVPAAMPDPLAPPGAIQPNYLLLVSYKVMQCANLSGPWTDSGLCATSWISAYTCNTAYYSNSVPMLTNTVPITSGGLSMGSVGFNIHPDPAHQQMFYRIQ